MAIIIIISGMAITQSFGNIESYRANSAMDIVVSQLRVARQLAISQRRSVQITINLGSSPQTISYQMMASTGVDSGLSGPLVTEPLPGQTNYVLENGVPDTPMGFGTCSGNSAVCIAGVAGGPGTMYFTSTGQFAADQYGTTPYNGTIFVGVPGQPWTARAVTIMGSTGRVRPYTFIGPVGGPPQQVWIE
jgi:type II secretory pathway pseudopilin PulG